MAFAFAFKWLTDALKLALEQALGIGNGSWGCVP